MLPMKRTVLFFAAALIGAAVLVMSQGTAPEPNQPSTSSSPPETQITKDPSSQGDPQTLRSSDRFEGRRHGFHHRDRHWKRHRDHLGEWKMLDRLLNLTDEQKEKVKEIMAASKPKIKAIREEQRAKIRAVLDDARQQIRPLLTPEQQKVFDDAQKLRDDARKLREESRALRQKKGVQSE
jgi:Spy/CpxP family protein refolding chaperone